MTRRQESRAGGRGSCGADHCLLGIGIPGSSGTREMFRRFMLDASEHFKYGSIGAEAENGIPYWVWLVLPDVFPEHLARRPRRGLQQVWVHLRADPPKGRPIGTSYREDPVPMVGLNCAVCHAGNGPKDSEQDGQNALYWGCPRIPVRPEEVPGLPVRSRRKDSGSMRTPSFRQ